MYSELIIVVSTGQEDTDKVWRTLESRQGGELLTMSDVVLIRRDSQGIALSRCTGERLII